MEQYFSQQLGQIEFTDILTVLLKNYKATLLIISLAITVPLAFRFFILPHKYIATASIRLSERAPTSAMTRTYYRNIASSVLTKTLNAKKTLKKGSIKLSWSGENPDRVNNEMTSDLTQLTQHFKIEISTLQQQRLGHLKNRLAFLKKKAEELRTQDPSTWLVVKTQIQAVANKYESELLIKTYLPELTVYAKEKAFLYSGNILLTTICSAGIGFLLSCLYASYLLTLKKE